MDGKNLLGPVVGNFCMDVAIKKARQLGVGWVAAKGKKQLFFFVSCFLARFVFSGSNHFGIAGWYAMRAADQGLMVSRGPGLFHFNTLKHAESDRTSIVRFFRDWHLQTQHL